MAEKTSMTPGANSGGHDDLRVVFGDELCGFKVALAVERDGAAESSEPVRLVRAEIRLGESRSRRHAAGIVVLDDDGRGLVHQIAQYVERVVRVGDVRLAGVLAGLQQLGDGREVAAGLEHLDVAEREVAVHETVERGLLAGVLAVAEPFLLAADRPRHLFVTERLARVAVNERYLHRRREMVRLDGPVRLFQVFHAAYYIKNREIVRVMRYGARGGR